MKTGIIDVLMFSISPVYDLMPEGVVIDDLTNMETYQQRDWAGSTQTASSCIKPANPWA